ncbi:TIGR03545 family protein [Gracilimonas amylolytica]|uniref:TIGR03545 family protein n=1 Tax=Gracilimonas amylolytica TaxID=1749045 RepID=UPI000CD9E228|nr:TIGR03545 family protein [Gracilimonas amylolytica]
MRLGGVVTILVLIGLGFAAAYFITDDWIESNVEYQASVMNEAKVEFDGFEFSLLNLKLKWDRLQVANKNNTMENTFETGETEFSMQFWPLILANKVVVDNVKLTGFELATERETDGYFEVPETEVDEEPGFIYSVVDQVAGQAQKNAQVKFTEIRSDLNVDSLMAKVDIRTDDKVDSLRNGIQQTYTKWDSTFNNTNISDEIAQINQTIDGIKVQEFKDPKNVVSSIEQVKKLKGQVDSLRNRAETLKQNFQNDYGTTRDEISQIDNWIQDDFQRAVNVAQLPDLDVQNIGKALFGENLLGDYAVYLEYVALAREYGSRFVGSDEETEKIPRYEGVDYHFTDKYDLPDLWFRNIELSGKTLTGIAISGQVTDISNDQEKAGEPIRFNIGGQDENQVNLSLNGEFNYLEDKPRESFEMNYSGFTLANTKLSGSDLLPYDLQTGKGNVNVSLDLIDKRIDSRIDYIANELSFDFASAGEPKNQLESLIRRSISSTDEIDVTALVDNVEGPLRIRLRSNIDDLFMNALRQTVSEEVAEARRKIEAEVQRQVAGKKEELAAFKSEKEAEIMERYNAIQEKIREQVEKVEQKQKELEEKKKELEDALKNKIKDRIGIDY